jgi:hypothetical protein
MGVVIRVRRSKLFFEQKRSFQSKKDLMTAYDHILEIVRQWPPDQRLLLLRDVIQTLSNTREPLRSPRDTLSRALGLVSSGEILPNDEEIKRMLDEHRMEKYG